MKNTISTIYGAYLQACLFFNTPFEMFPNTTLNEKLGVLAGTAPYPNERPTVRYVAIGNAGHKNVTGASGRHYTTGQQHDARDAALFNMIPFVARPVNNDLSQAEREKYGLRTVRAVNGINYVFYWLKRLPSEDVRPAMTINTKVGGVIQSRPFVPTSDNLNPTPIELSSGEVLTASGEYAAVSAVIEFLLTAVEIEQIIEACRILYDNEHEAIISEIATVAGVDRITQGSASGNNTIEYKEVICAQVVGILNTYHSLPNANAMIKETMTLGTSDPMLTNTGLTVQG